MEQTGLPASGAAFEKQADYGEHAIEQIIGLDRRGDIGFPDFRVADHEIVPDEVELHGLDFQAHAQNRFSSGSVEQRRGLRFLVLAWPYGF
jgi:hypothetical protein